MPRKAIYGSEEERNAAKRESRMQWYKQYVLGRSEQPSTLR